MPFTIRLICIPAFFLHFFRDVPVRYSLNIISLSGLTLGCGSAGGQCVVVLENINR